MTALDAKILGAVEKLGKDALMASVDNGAAFMADLKQDIHAAMQGLEKYAQAAQPATVPPGPNHSPNAAPDRQPDGPGGPN